MAMLNRVAGVVRAGPWLLRANREDVSSALLGVGVVTCTTALRAACAAAAAASVPSTALAGAVLGGMAAMWAAVWVAADGRRRDGTGRVILCAALVPLVVAVGLGDSDPELVVDIVDALL